MLWADFFLQAELTLGWGVVVVEKIYVDVLSTIPPAGVCGVICERRFHHNPDHLFGRVDPKRTFLFVQRIYIYIFKIYKYNN